MRKFGKIKDLLRISESMYVLGAQNLEKKFISVSSIFFYAQCRLTRFPRTGAETPLLKFFSIGFSGTCNERNKGVNTAKNNKDVICINLMKVGIKSTLPLALAYSNDFLSLNALEIRDALEKQWFVLMRIEWQVGYRLSCTSQYKIKVHTRWMGPTTVLHNEVNEWESWLWSWCMWFYSRLSLILKAKIRPMLDNWTGECFGIARTWVFTASHDGLPGFPFFETICARHSNHSKSRRQSPVSPIQPLDEPSMYPKPTMRPSLGTTNKNYYDWNDVKSSL